MQFGQETSKIWTKQDFVIYVKWLNDWTTRQLAISDPREGNSEG